jgi:hypothetical protein
MGKEESRKENPSESALSILSWRGPRKRGGKGRRGEEEERRKGEETRGEERRKRAEK